MDPGPGCGVCTYIDGTGTGWYGTVWYVEDENGVLSFAPFLTQTQRSLTVVRVERTRQAQDRRDYIYYQGALLLQYRVLVAVLE